MLCDSSSSTRAGLDLGMSPALDCGLEAWGRSDGFNPLSLSPALWLSDTGNDPSVWPDISGNKRDFTQSYAPSRPTIVAGALNGRQVRRFNNSVLKATFSMQTTFCALVCKRSTIDGSYPSAIGGLGLVNESFLTFQGGAPNIYYPRGTGYINGVRRSNTEHPTPVPNVWFIYFFGGATGATTFSVGNRYTIDQPFPGDIAEIIFFASALSIENRQRVERHLGQKWGIPVA